MAIVSPRAMVHSAVMMVVVIIEDGAYNDASNEAPN